MKNKILILILALLIPTMSWARNYTSDLRCVAAYLMLEGSGTTTADNSINGFGGTATFSGSPTWQSSVPSFSKFGSAKNSINFPDTGSSTPALTAGTNNGVSPTGSAMTVVAWVYPTEDETISAGDPRIFSRVDASNDGVGWFLDNTNTNDFTVNFGTAASGVVTTVGSAYTLNTWQFFAFEYDGSVTATNQKLYVNGTLIAHSINTNASGNASNSGSTLYLGNRADKTRPLGGMAAQYGFFNKLLTTTELTDIQNNGLTGNGSFFFSKEYRYWKKFYHNEGYV